MRKPEEVPVDKQTGTVKAKTTLSLIETTGFLSFLA